MSVFIDHLVIPNGAPRNLSTDKLTSWQWTPIRLQGFCSRLWIIKCPTFDDNPLSCPGHGQVKGFNKMAVTRLWHYEADHLIGWNPFVQPLTYSSIGQVHDSTGTTPFSLVFSCHMMDPAVTDLRLAIPNDILTPRDLRSFCKIFLRKLASLRACTDQTLKPLKCGANISPTSLLTSPQRSYQTRSNLFTTVWNCSLQQLTSRTSRARGYYQKPWDHSK